MEINKVYNGNSLDVLKTFPDESLDMCITSPPYWGLRDYGTEGQIWDGDDKCKHDFDKSKRILHTGTWSKNGEKNVLPHYKNATKVHWEIEEGVCNKCGAWRGELGLEPTPEMFVNHLCDIFDEVKRCLRPHGSCWVNLGDTYANSGYGKGTGNMQNKNNPGAMTPKVKCDLPQKCLVQIPSRFAIEMTNRGWVLRNEIIWHKPSCLPSPATDRYTVDFEKMFFFTKKPKYYFKQQFEPMLTKPHAPGNKFHPTKVSGPNDRGGKSQWDDTSRVWGAKSQVPYSVQPRTKEFVYFRELPEHDDIRKYLIEWKEKLGITIKKIEEHFDNQTGHHWFERGGSYPSVEDWEELKELLGFDDKYDKDMTTEYEKSSEKTSDSRGRNKRTVWHVSTAKFEGAHFAVYPPELIESPIDASCPLYVCTKCGKPREIILEKSWANPVEEPDWKEQNKKDWQKTGKSRMNKGKFPTGAIYEENGYTDCGCGEEFVPGVVLDPFFGSGTTAEVAMKQDKNWVGIDLNDDYIKISDKRLEPTIREKKTRDKASEFWE